MSTSKPAPDRAGSPGPPNGIEFGRIRISCMPEPSKAHVLRRFHACAEVFLSGLTHGPGWFIMPSRQSVPKEAAMDPRIENLETTTFFAEFHQRTSLSCQPK